MQRLLGGKGEKTTIDTIQCRKRRNYGGEGTIYATEMEYGLQKIDAFNALIMDWLSEKMKNAQKTSRKCKLLVDISLVLKYTCIASMENVFHRLMRKTIIKR